MRKIIGGATGIAAAVIMGAVPASASVVHDEFTVPGGTQWVQVTENHGAIVHFEVHYSWDSYVHQDILPASQKITEIDNYTGQNPDTGKKFNGCAASRHPDRLTTWDDDALGVLGQPHTGLHHNANLTFTPSGSGPYFSWCHYEHGPETWVKLTWNDGSTTEIYWKVATRFDEILLSAGSADAVTPLGTADE